jgi:hypothetical protein
MTDEHERSPATDPETEPETDVEAALIARAARADAEAALLEGRLRPGIVGRKPPVPVDRIDERYTVYGPDLDPTEEEPPDEDQTIVTRP